jgi:hypothetical protein
LVVASLFFNLIFSGIDIHDILGVSVLCNNIYALIKPIFEHDFTFRFVSLVFFVIFFRILSGKSMVTLSPQNAIVYSPSIPPKAIKLTLVMANYYLFEDFLLFAPPTLTHLTLERVDHMDYLSSTLTYTHSLTTRIHLTTS